MDLLEFGTYILDVLGEFGAGRGPNSNEYVRFGLGTALFSTLLLLAVRRRAAESDPREAYLIAGFGFGLFREAFMFPIMSLQIQGIVETATLELFFPPLEHALLLMARVTIAAAFLYFLLDSRKLANRFMAAGFVLTLAFYVVAAPIWWFEVAADPDIRFSEFRGDVVIHSLGAGLSLTAVILFATSDKWARAICSFAFALFFFDDALMLINLGTGEVYKTILTPIRHNLHIWAIPILGYIYIREQQLTNLIREQQLSNLRLERRLQESEKLRAVGQLTGGVAHDFNNLLAVIMGNAELLKETQGLGRREIDAIIRASLRGAELTQRLLAFSRKQTLVPQIIDLGALISGMSDTLARTLGATIEISIFAPPDIWAASADPGQVENVLLNLALNSRDAMPGGGKLIVECANRRLDEDYVAKNHEARTGDYVVLQVSDEGCGMTVDEQSRAFEPFFTTKEVGQGSGLGLSMIYGFAKQSGGHVNIYSEEGKGTTVRFYLPRSQATAPREAAVQVQDIPRGNGEMILVIEDDPDVRSLAVSMLENLDYRVIDAAEAEAAYSVLESGKQVDLVLSDVILPGGVSGPEFADTARKTYPDLKVIFMSGYPAEAAKRNGFLGSDQVLLNKPFQRSHLAQAIHAALG